MAKKPICACGNPKCRVAELTERASGQKPAADAERAARPSWSTRFSRAEKTYRDTERSLGHAARECANRKRLLALGTTCPLCARPVAAYGVPATAETCGIVGPFEWRRRGDVWTSNEIETECKNAAWARLTAALAARVM